MEGPTPVSALIHSATMVTAGVFLFLRTAYLIDMTPVILSTITYIGLSTSFIMASIAFFHYDTKKILAYSTCSQLGYMMIAIGLSQYNSALFHLFTHAFFKALLFLSIGTIIHNNINEQDIRKTSSVLYFLPVITVTACIGLAALSGLPFFSGFFSKEYILNTAFIFYNLSSNIIFWGGHITAFLTLIYSIKLSSIFDQSSLYLNN